MRRSIFPVILAAFINCVASRRLVTSIPGGGVFGQPITDACLGWEDAERLIYFIAENV